MLLKQPVSGFFVYTCIMFKASALLHYVIFLTVFVFLNLQAVGQYVFDYNPQIIKAYHETGRLRFDVAEQILQKEKQRNPQNLAIYHIENSIDFLKILISENENLFDELEKNKSRRIEMLQKGDQNSPYFRYAIAELNVQWAFSRLKFKEYLSAFFEVRRAYKLLEENQENFPGFLPNLIGLGFLHTLVGSVPENYRWVTDFVGVDGDMDQGIKELSEVLDSALTTQRYAHLRAQSLLFLSFIHLNLQKDMQQAAGLRDIVGKHCAEPESKDFSPIMVYIYAKLLMKTGENDMAISLLEKYPADDPQYYPMHYLDFMLGKAYLHALDPKAGLYLQKYITEFEGRNFLKSAAMMASWNAFIHGDLTEYQKYKSLIGEIGETDVEPDKVAKDYSKDERFPNICILRGRMLFDGGYLKRAINELESTQCCSTLRDHEDSLEHTYRLARAYHESGQFDEALKNYARTVDEGRDDHFYYAANAALKSGLIYENQGEFEKAKECYKMVKKMSFDQYEGSIKQKAKAGMHRLEKTE